MKTYIENDTFNFKLSPIDIPYEDTRPLLERELERRDIIANINDPNEKYRRKLMELLIGMGKRPYETTWEELLITDPKLVEEIKKSVDIKTIENINTPSNIKSGYENIKPNNILSNKKENNFNINAKEFKPKIEIIKTFDKGFNDIILQYFNDFWYEYTDEEKENLKNYIIEIITEYNDTKNIEIAYEQLADLLLYWVDNIDFLIETCYSDESCKKYFDSLIM
jgi:hypothetical protein